MRGSNAKSAWRLTGSGPRLDKAETLFLRCGFLLLWIYFSAQCYSFVFSRAALWLFGTAKASDAVTQPAAVSTSSPIDFSLWANGRIAAYRATLALKLAPPIAVLRVPKVHLTAPVFEGTDELNLNRGLGRISGTAAPGSNGNVAIAGHRDGFFRGLKDVGVGDLIELETHEAVDTYQVEGIEIVNPANVDVLQPTSAATITLVTCYPFYFVGDAPQRFIVKGALKTRVPVASTISARQ